jgi:hypothetical protein
MNESGVDLLARAVAARDRVLTDRDRALVEVGRFAKACDSWGIHPRFFDVTDPENWPEVLELARAGQARVVAVWDECGEPMREDGPWEGLP